MLTNGLLDALIAGLDPAIHLLEAKNVFAMDARVKPGHDESRVVKVGIRLAKRNRPLSRRMANYATLMRQRALRARRISSFRGKPSPRALIAGDLGNHLLHDGAAEGLEILRHDDEGPGAPNDVVAIVFLQSAGRIDMLDIPDE